MDFCKMKPFKEIQLDIAYDESFAILRRLFELSVKRLVIHKNRVPEELAKIDEFENGLDNIFFQK